MPLEIAIIAVFTTPDTYLAIVGVLITVAGFTITIWQILRTARASEATRKAVQSTEARMALNHILVVIPQLRILEQDLDRAIEDGDRLAAMRALGSYSYVVSEVSGLLGEQDVMDAETVERLKSSAVAAGQAKSRLLDSANTMPKSATREFRQDLAEVATALNALVGRYRLQSEERDQQ